MTTMEMRNMIEPPHIRFDSRIAELLEVHSTVGLVIDKLLPEDHQQPDTDIEEAIDCLFIIQREIRRIADDMKDCLSTLELIPDSICQQVSEGGDQDGEKEG